MKKFDHFKSNLNVLALADQEDLTNEFIIGSVAIISSVRRENLQRKPCLLYVYANLLHFAESTLDKSRLIIK